MSQQKSSKEGLPFIFHIHNKEVSKSGATIVYSPENKKMSFSLCCPKDNFSRERGRTIAINRLSCEQSVVNGKQRRRFSPVFNDIVLPRKPISILMQALPMLRDAAVAVENSHLVSMCDDYIRNLATAPVG